MADGGWRKAKSRVDPFRKAMSAPANSAGVMTLSRNGIILLLPISDCGSWILGSYNPRAPIVGRRNDYPGAFGICGGQHGSRNLLRRAKSDCTDGRTRSAQESPERACGFGRSDDAIEEWDHFLAERLVQVIDEGALKFLVFARGKCGGDGACVPAVFHGVQAIDLGRPDTTRLFCFDLEI